MNIVKMQYFMKYFMQYLEHCKALIFSDAKKIQLILSLIR